MCSSDLSQVFIIIDLRQLGSAEFSNRVADGVVEYVIGSIPAEGAGSVRYPGESTLQKRLEQREKGILVDEGVWAEVQRLAGIAA